MDDTPEDDVPAGLRSRPRTVVISILAVLATIALMALIIVPLFLTPTPPPAPRETDGSAPTAAAQEKGLDVSYRLPIGLGGGIRRTAGQTVALQCPVDGEDAHTYGTGFLVAPDIIVSAAHVASAKRSGAAVKAYCGGPTAADGIVIALDELRDVMVIRTTGCPADAVAFDTRKLEVNDPLHVAGFNFSGPSASAARYYSMTSPIPAASFGTRDAIGDPDVSQRVIDMEKAHVPRFRAIAGAAVPGNSGSPVFTDEGKIVGMLVIRDPRHNRSYFVPARTLVRVLSGAGIN
jgi:S1-C subfamily serine protease